MLKMQIGPDELLKTKGQKMRSDEFMKIKELSIFGVVDTQT